MNFANYWAGSTVPSEDIEMVFYAGVSTWEAPSTVSEVTVTMIAGGAGGGSGGSQGRETGGNAGGGGGRYIDHVLAVTPGQSYSLTVGAGGSQGKDSGTGNSRNGGVGGNTTFDILLTATGGAPITGGTPDGTDGQAANANWTAGGPGISITTGEGLVVSGGAGGGGAKGGKGNGTPGTNGFMWLRYTT